MCPLLTVVKHYRTNRRYRDDQENGHPILEGDPPLTRYLNQDSPIVLAASFSLPMPNLLVARFEYKMYSHLYTVECAYQNVRTKCIHKSGS